ncbi:MAG: biotin/lipoyl-binding protein [Bacteroidales bacterium]|jgi:biotin carboxyl carrier protein|nr:biotin/lipoyl-binding protein [Bacteroidales bacterium]MDD2425435.1 biotin/lipoyl-binding protein [Bacteroidales bacterium]MDD3988890.1 biotin/lipoyl-binding protein [Bacteroidales bacterium]MDD4639273.1 biotin/lipoyl-binding protein [Bacteroidales bacterium]
MKEYKLKINGNDYTVNITEVEDTFAEVEVNGTPFKVEIDRAVKKSPVITRPVSSSIQTTVSKPTATVTPPVVSGQTEIKSPLPGVILEVSVKEGDSIKKGQKLMVLEAMKMENVIESSADGKVIAIKVGKGDSVLEGASLIIIG